MPFPLLLALLCVLVVRRRRTKWWCLQTTDRPTQRTNERWQNLIHHLSSTILRVCAAAAPHRRCRPPLHIIKTVPSVSSSRRLRRPSACLPLPPRTTTTTFCAAADASDFFPLPSIISHHHYYTLPDLNERTTIHIYKTLQNQPAAASAHQFHHHPVSLLSSTLLVVGRFCVVLKSSTKSIDQAHR